MNFWDSGLISVFIKVGNQWWDTWHLGILVKRYYIDVSIIQIGLIKIKRNPINVKNLIKGIKCTV